MKAFLLIIFSLIIGHFTYAQDKQAQLLEHAYKHHSKKELKQFFDNWHKEIPPISDSEFSKLDSLQKEAYRVFYASFDVSHFSKLLNSKRVADGFKSAQVLILDNTLKLYKIDDLPNSLPKANRYSLDSFRYPPQNQFKIDSAENFKPAIIIKNKTINYASSKYSRMLYLFYFPRKSLISFRKKNIFPSQKKIDFLRTYALLDTDGGIQISCSYIVFNAGISKALIDYWICDQNSGFDYRITFLLSKNDKTWNITDSTVHFMQLM